MADRQELARTQTLVLRELCKRKPYEWLRRYVKTFDEWDEEHPVKPFPLTPYVKPILDELQKEDIVHIAKSRQMSISWLIMAYLLHKAQFFPHRLIAVFSKKERDAQEMVERAKFMYNNQPDWLKALCPLDRKIKDMPFGYLYFANSSKIAGFAEGEQQVRGYVPSVAFLDEAAKQDKLRETYGACVPCAKQIITVSSADAGFFQELVEL